MKRILFNLLYSILVFLALILPSQAQQPFSASQDSIKKITELDQLDMLAKLNITT